MSNVDKEKVKKSLPPNSESQTFWPQCQSTVGLKYILDKYIFHFLIIFKRRKEGKGSRLKRLPVIENMNNCVFIEFQLEELNWVFLLGKVQVTQFNLLG